MDTGQQAGDPKASEALVQDLASDRKLARALSTTPEALDQLSKSSDGPTRRAVAKNPSTPKPTLLILARQFPLEVFNNPTFAWLLLEDPDLFGRLDDSVITRLLKHKDCPLTLMEWECRRWPRWGRNKLAVAANPNAPARLLRRLVKFGDAVGEAASLHRNLAGKHPAGDAPRLEDILRAALREIDPKDARAEWRKGNLGPGQWPFLSAAARLAIHAEVWGLSFFSSFRNLNDPVRHALPDHARALAGLAELEVRLALAQCDLTPATVLEELAQDEDAAVRCEVALNPSTPANLSVDLINSLAITSFGDGMRERVARNKRSPGPLLDKLSRSRDLREHVAANLAASTEILERLAGDRSADVREAVAANPSTPLHVLRLLASDRKQEVRIAVGANESASADSIRELVQQWGLHSMAHEVAHNPAAPEGLRQEALSLWMEVDERYPKRTNFRSKREALSQFDLLVEAALRWAKAMHKAAKRNGWNLLDPVFNDVGAAERVALHRQECAHVLLDPSNTAIARLMAAGRPRALMNSLPNDRIPSALRSKVRAVRLLALCQSSVDRKALIKFHRSLEWTERFAVAAHDATPSGVLAALAKDANRWVAAAACGRPLDREVKTEPTAALAGDIRAKLIDENINKHSDEAI